MFESMDKAFFEMFWRWGGWLLSFIVSWIGRRFIVRTLDNEVMMAILQTLGEGLMILGAGLFLMWIGYTIWQITPSQRFRRMKPYLKILASWHSRDVSCIPTHRAAIRKLDILKIPHPGKDDTVKKWRIFYRILWGEAEVGAIKEARQVLDEINVTTQVVQDCGIVRVMD